MKRIFLTFTMAMLAILSFAQIPQAFSYQAVIRDAENNLVVSQPIFLELSVLQGSDDGEVVYSEKHVVSTNSNGLISLEMGAGVSRDDFSAIDWSNAPYFVKTVFEFDGKQISGVTPLLSVPYALYAEKAGSADIDLSDYALKNDIPTDYVTSSTLNGYVKKSDIDLSDYALKNDIPTDYVTNSTLNDYAKKTDILEVDLSGYYSKVEIDALLKKLKAEIGNDGGSSQQGNIAVGAIKAAFSISDSKQIYFSQGNLQYQASTGTWRFAEHQYDIIGSDNSNISSSYSGWIDLFGWGTSGWNSGANAYQPYSTSTSDSDYYPGGDYTNNLTGSYANADWGVYNKISNGGNAAGMWRTLTNSEWDYVISNRTDARYLRGMAIVNGVNGLILLPDNWTLPTGVTFTYGEDGWSQNTYSASDWSKMEANGAVFLPATGVNNAGSHGVYWSSSAGGSDGACTQYFGSFGVYTYSNYRHSGLSVRLVQDVK
ncbi:MAG: hypothetical protein IKJ98_07725 [Bacteroidales bacterium]|nr:hypothetical protein [Bacteroidales bacterium]